MHHPARHLFLLLGIFCLVYLLLYPGIPLITDEISYFNRAFALVQGKKDLVLNNSWGLPELSLIEGNYPLGTALFLIPYVKWFGAKAVFISGLVYFLLSFWFCFLALERSGKSVLILLLFFLFLPLLILSRSLMSEMPSLLLVSLSVYLFYSHKNSPYNALALGFTCGLSIAFRETNLVLIFPLVLASCYENRKNILPSIAGLVSGSMLRFVSAYWVYGDAFYMKSSYPFSISFIPENLIIYSFILLVLIPFSPIWVILSKGRSLHLLKYILILFVFIHLCYGYNATEYSGFKYAVVLNGRFFIPALPLFILLLGGYVKTYPLPKLLYYSIIGCGVLLIIGSQWLYHEKQAQHLKIAESIHDRYGDKITLVDRQFKTSAMRYFNPLIGKFENALDLESSIQANIISKLLKKETPIYVLSFHQSGTAKKTERTADELVLLQKLKTSYTLKKDTIYRTPEGMQINGYKLLYDQ